MTSTACSPPVGPINLSLTRAQASNQFFSYSKALQCQYFFCLVWDWVFELPTAVEIETQFVLQASNRLVHQFHQEVSFTQFHLPPNGFFLSLIFPLLSRAGLKLPNSRAKGAPVALIAK